MGKRLHYYPDDGRVRTYCGTSLTATVLITSDQSKVDCARCLSALLRHPVEDEPPLVDPPAVAKKLDLPAERPATVVKFRVTNWSGYVAISEHEGRPVEIFIHCAKEGSTIQGFLDSLAIAISIGLRCGVPAEYYVKALSGVRFEPQGYAQLGEQTGVEVSSIVDAIIRILVARYPELGSGDEA